LVEELEQAIETLLQEEVAEAGVAKGGARAVG
jgi:hypothetical protein